MAIFGVYSILVFDNVSYFSSTLLSEFTLDKGIILWYSSKYYPQGNGSIESTNKNMVRIIKREVVGNHQNWHNALHIPLWAERVIPKESLGNSPYFLVYGKESILPTKPYLPYL